MGKSIQDGMVVTIRYSKTDQTGKSVFLKFDTSQDFFLCPVRAMIDFLRIRNLVTGPLFSHFGGTPLTCYQFNHVLKKGVKLLGLSPVDFSSHSFRIGAATSAAMCGVSDDQIKKWGRWKSSAFELYIRPDFCSFI